MVELSTRYLPGWADILQCRATDQFLFRLGTYFRELLYLSVLSPEGGRPCRVRLPSNPLSSGKRTLEACATHHLALQLGRNLAVWLSLPILFPAGKGL